MTTLTDFLLARIAEDEAVATVCALGWVAAEDMIAMEGVSESVLVKPARVLAECDAKRRIVGAHLYSNDGRHSCAHPTRAVGQWNYDEWEPCVTLALLALPYADHPDYDEEWKP